MIDEIKTTPHDIHAWPYAAMRKNYDEGKKTWTETDVKVFDNQLGCVPPARQFASGFAVGECYIHNKKGAAIHAVFVKIRGRYFCRLAILRDFDIDVYKKEILDQFLDLTLEVRL